MQQFLVAATLVKQPSSASQTRYTEARKEFRHFANIICRPSVPGCQEAEYRNKQECGRVCLCFIYCQIKNLTFVSNI